MAIDAYTGLPGSGKSYSVVKFVILPSLKQGRLVITNIPLAECAHDEFPGLIQQLPLDWYKDETLFEAVPNGAVIVLDELWRRWPKGMPATKVPFRDKEFLAEHRHMVDEEGNSTRVVLVTQDLDQLAAFATMLVDTTYQSVKLSAIGANKRFRVDIYQGAAKGQRPPKSRLLRSVFDKYEAGIHRYYQSATKSLSGQVGDESKADNRGSIWKSPLVLFTLCAPLLLAVLVWQISKFFSGGMSLKPEEPVAEVQAVDSVLVNPLPPGMSAPAVPSEPATVSTSTVSVANSSVWRVAGYMRRADPDAEKMRDVVMLTSIHGVRYVPLEDCEAVSMGVDYQCEIDGEVVTPWSGPISQSMASFVLGGANESVNAGAEAVGLGGERSAAPEGRPRGPVTSL